MRSFLLIFILILASCGEKVIEEPNDLIAKEKMVDILYDLALINAAKSTNPKILEEKGEDVFYAMRRELRVQEVSGTPCRKSRKKRSKSSLIFLMTNLQGLWQ